MSQGYFLKKRLQTILKSLVFVLLKAVIYVYKFIFAKRTVLFVTNNKIRTVNLGPILQGCFLILFVWICNLFMQSLKYNEAIATKSSEIEKLKSVNNYFEEEVEDINEKLKKINEYLISVTGFNHQVKSVDSNFKQPKDFKEDDLSKKDKGTFNEIKRAEFQLAQIKSATESRAKKIESALAMTGLNIKKKPAQETIAKIKEISLNDKKPLAQGGPLGEDNSLEEAASRHYSSLSYQDDVEKQLEKVKFVSDIDYLLVLEKLAFVMPFSKPMKNYYISSNFGTRFDPLTRRKALHKGLDFVGSNKEKIISPSYGKVILARRFSDYGNAIVIDHGFGVTTRYGHLSEIRVREGQIVRKGDLLALQGNTGRSTGAHLHYEVRYKNTPLNPKRFLEAGESLINEEKPQYVRS